jgi:hypothetical protein
MIKWNTRSQETPERTCLESASVAWGSVTRNVGFTIATKVHRKIHDGPNGAGLSRKAILSEIDKRLARHCIQKSRLARNPATVAVRIPASAASTTCRSNVRRQAGVMAML